MVSPFNTVMYYSFLFEKKTGEFVLQKRNLVLKDGQEMPQSQTADQHTATRGRDTDNDRPHHN